jgi:pescadillo protein
VVKERYPTFYDAVRDLDDALSMVFLFSTLPQTDNITADIGSKCRQLALEFQTYVIKRRLLRKTFLSIKGIYYQVELMGHQVTWIVPYEFSMLIPSDVDFRVMLTFLDFYETLLGFVNFKFFADLNLNYPPVVDHSLDDGNGGLYALIFRTVKLSFDGSESALISSQPAEAPKTKKKRKMADCLAPAALKPEIASKLKEMAQATLSAATEEEEEAQQEEQIEADANFPDFCCLFSKFHFFLSREVPRFSLEFVIRCFGGRVGWENGAGSPYAESDIRVTHQIVDRPSLSHIHPNRIYIQPQWVYDCINARSLLPADLYRVGAILPSHLSPFVDQMMDEDGFGERTAAIADSSDDEPTAVEDAAANKELALSMMSKKHRKLYGQIQHGKNKKKEEQLKLKEKKKAAASSAKSIQ